MTFIEWWQKLGIFHGRDTVSGLIEPMAFAALTWDAARPKWQPIETAPMEKWCLFLDGNKTMRESIYGQNQHIDKILKTERGQTANAYIHNYTHWMPLPPAPEEQ